MMLQESERQILQWALDSAGSPEKAANVLGVNDGFFYHRCRAVGIHIRKEQDDPEEPESV